MDEIRDSVEHPYRLLIIFLNRSIKRHHSRSQLVAHHRTIGFAGNDRRSVLTNLAIAFQNLRRDMLVVDAETDVEFSFDSFRMFRNIRIS